MHILENLVRKGLCFFGFHAWGNPELLGERRYDNLHGLKEVQLGEHGCKFCPAKEPLVRITSFSGAGIGFKGECRRLDSEAEHMFARAQVLAKHAVVTPTSGMQTTPGMGYQLQKISRISGIYGDEAISVEIPISKLDAFETLCRENNWHFTYKPIQLHVPIFLDGEKIIMPIRQVTGETVMREATVF